ncbi:MAG TPA: hypothetical protein VGR43_04385, partial [Dehalococcoidia bacterium]|nr:hypothetical protein [Dehalococcoidia bacterium]
MRTGIMIGVTAAITAAVLAYFVGESDGDRGPLVARLRIDEQHPIGEPIPMSLEIENTSGEQ